MKIWTYAEARTKIQEDLDLQDQTFVLSNELIGYFNEGIKESEAEIIGIDEEYFLASYPLPLVLGTSVYDYPYDMYGYKVRGIIYSFGSVIYEVREFGRMQKFENMAYSDQYGSSDDYRWWHSNQSSIGAKINLKPAARETAVVPPNANPSTPVTLWYIRQANRIPRLGEYIPQWDTLAPTSVDPTADQITVANSYTTGDTVKLTTSGTMPGGLTKNTVYYVIAGSGTIKLATTLQNSSTGTAIDITSTGSGVLYISVAANQTVIDNTLIDIPEFIEFIVEWAKVRCTFKEGDPRTEMEAGILEKARAQMVATLKGRVQDDHTELQQDLSYYNQMS